ncbi:MAG TPA: methyltransferase domain-containing protein [Xanthomonadaceae bacterium]
MAEAVNYNAWLARRVALVARSGDQILDFGAGTGTFASILAQAGHSVACVEDDEELARRLRTDGFEVVASLDRIEAGTIDYVYSLNVLEHIQDDAAALAGIARALAPGGTLLLYVPAFQVLYSSMDRKVGHFRRYRRQGLEALAAAAGFIDVRSRYADSLGFFAALAYRWIGSDSGTLDRRSVVLYDRCVFPVSRMLDRLFGRLFGKNVLLTACKPPVRG